MSEFEDKLNAILSNPDAMAQVMNLAQSVDLGGGSGGRQGTAQNAPSPPSSPPAAAGSGGDALGGLAGLGDLLGQIDPKTIQRLLPLMGELAGGGGNDERMQLLYALRPFLKPERRDKVERAAKAAPSQQQGKMFFLTPARGHGGAGGPRPPGLLHLGKRFLTTMGGPNV